MRASHSTDVFNDRSWLNTTPRFLTVGLEAKAMLSRAMKSHDIESLSFFDGKITFVSLNSKSKKIMVKLRVRSKSLFWGFVDRARCLQRSSENA